MWHEKFLSKIEINKHNNCWIWRGSVKSNGYGRFMINGKYQNAHKVSYIIFNGKIINGLIIDHKCRNRLCVNPDHLRQVTYKINAIENNSSKAAINSKKEKCNRGHLLIGTNLRIRKNGGRICILCVEIRNKQRNRRFKNG